MNKKIFSGLLALVFMLSATGLVFAWSTTGGDGGNYGALQEVAIFFNNSGAQLGSGFSVVLDRTGTGVTAGSTLGSYVTTTTAADSIEAIGVVQTGYVCPDQTACPIVTKGPVECRSLDLSDAVTTGVAVGTATTAGRCGGGTNLGTALEAGNGADQDMIWIWVQPTGAD